MGRLFDMSVSGGSSMMHVGLQCLDGSPMKHVDVSAGFPIRHVALRWVSDNNNIFVNSSKLIFFLSRSSFCPSSIYALN